jgi:hypothetical protein
MIYTITIILFVLVSLNFFLLKFSCNQTMKTKKYTKPYIIKPTESQKFITTQSVSTQLAPTGS